MDFTPDWGDVPTWLAFLAAALAGFGAYRLLSVEQGRDEARRDDELRWQADGVAAWPESRVSDGSRMRIREGAAVGNNTPLPIYDVVVTWWYPAGNVEGAPLELRHVQPTQPVVPPEGDFLGVRREGNGSWTPHRRDVMRKVNPQTQEVIQEGYRDNLDWFRLSIEFTDTAGNRWLRGTNGRLSRLLRPEEQTPIRHRRWGTILRKN